MSADHPARNLLAGIAEPRDLHKLSDRELRQLSDEVRAAILDKVSKTGGHFSSNLGTVELTVGMYGAYSIPPDVVVWDTGHQAYPHKLLTGRYDQFDTLRKYKGISGFLRREEHALDYFGAGHAGTAISAALGFAVARDRNGERHKVVAVTGDASICSGMSWEALNHAGEMQTDLTVVLNDNRMSIAPNVGALTSHFARLRSRPFVQDLAHRAREIVERLPGPVNRVAAGLRHGLTHYFAPEETGAIFEEIGFEYIGPIDGHDLTALLEVFRNVRELRGPVFIHTITVKGKGYQVAEDDATKWHGVVPFDLSACEMTKSAGPPTFTQAFSDAAVECAGADDKIVAITAAMPDGTGLNRFAKAFPDRTYDVGIAEQHAVTFAAGLAAAGYKPFCAIYSTFLQRGFDQVLHDVAIQNLPVRFFLDRSGLVGDDGPTHHGAFDLSYLGLIPNMTIAAPRDAAELADMVRFAAAFDRGPIAVRYPRGATDDRLPKTRSALELGRAEVLGWPSPDNAADSTRIAIAVDSLDGTDRPLAVAVFAIGSMVSVAWEAANELARRGVRGVVVNARFAKPIDAETFVDWARRARQVVTIEENVKTGGFGQSVRDALVEAGLGHLRHDLMSLPDAFVEHGAQPLIRRDCGLDPESVVQRVLQALPGAVGAR